jgi:hypothetical protein
MPSDKPKTRVGSKRAAPPSPSSSHTMSPNTLSTPPPTSSVTIPSTKIDWVRKQGLSYPFPTLSYAANGTELPGNVLEFEIEGKVVSAFLKADALSHAIILKVDNMEVEKLKLHAKDGPRHNQSNFRWPIEGMEIKVVSKVNLQNDFTPIWNQSTQEKLTPEDVEEGSSVLVNFTPIFYLGKKSKGSDAGFGPGLTLRLNAVYVVSKGAAFANLDFESPSKRRKVSGSGTAV